MVDERKLRLMTEVEMIKRQNKREIFTRKTFYAYDFVVLGLVKSVLGATIAYITLITIIFLSQADEILVETDLNGLVSLAFNYLNIYVLILIATIPLSILQHVKLYHKTGKYQRAYRKALDELEESYEGK